MGRVLPLFATMAAAAAVWLHAPTAMACKCKGPPTIALPRLDGLAPTQQHASLRCDGGDPARCTWRSTHVFVVPAGAGATIAGSLPPADDGELRLELPDGTTVEGSTTDEVSFEVAATRGVPIELVLSGTLTLPADRCGCHPHGIRSRHLAVSPLRTEAKHTLRFISSGGALALTIDEDIPGELRVDPPVAVQRHRSGGRDRTELTVNDVSRLEWRRRFVRGGPLLAAGGGWGSSRAVRVRAGYELAYPERVIYALVGESDTTNAVIVPSVQHQTRQNSVLVVLPSVGTGVGVPIRVYPEPRAGVRLQLDLSWWVVSFVGTFDIYPPTKTAATQLVGALYGQVNF